MKLISVCIPTYEMGGQGHIFLEKSLNILCNQTFKDFDVVISDGSKDDAIKDVCAKYNNRLDIHYHRNPNSKGASSNLNYVISKATGKLIKLLCQDDYLYGTHSLEIVAKNFDLEKDTWLVTGCVHTKNDIDFFNPFHPRYNNRIHLGKNTIGAPSVLTIKNDHPLFFDENFMWFLDCDYYKRYHDRYGMPKTVSEIAVAIRLGEHQLTNTLATKQVRRKEFLNILAKYEKGFPYWFYKNIPEIFVRIGRHHITNAYRKITKDTEYTTR